MGLFFDFYRTLRFATRLPLPLLDAERQDPLVGANAFAVSFVLCGLVVGTLAAVWLGVLQLTGISPLLVALLTLALMVLLTGALHEDGLADVADGFGGGRTPERKLAIMRDPTIGTYGVLALLISVGIKAVTLAEIIEHSALLCVLVICPLQMLSRAFSMVASAWLPHAQPDGASARLGRPSAVAVLMALSMATLISLILIMPVGFLFERSAALLVSFLAVLLGMAISCIGLCLIAKRHIGGQTGDVLGAVQQVTDLAGLVIVTICLGVII